MGWDRPDDGAHLGGLRHGHSAERHGEDRGLVDVLHADMHRGWVAEGAHAEEASVHVPIQGLHTQRVAALCLKVQWLHGDRDAGG